MSIDTDQVLAQAYHLIQSEPKFRLDWLTEQVILRFFYAACELDLNSFAQLQGSQLEERLRQEVEDRTGQTLHTTYAKNGYTLALRALLLAYQEATGESYATTRVYRIVEHVRRRVAQEATSINREALEVYLGQYQRLGTFDLFESDGRRRGRAKVAEEAAWEVFYISTLLSRPRINSFELSATRVS